ncbi:MAG: pyruvate ferredoxin oxidoreductase [Desulfosudaceae bacterium]
MHTIATGNTAAAIGVKLARTQVIAAYPITPQTPLTEKLSEFVAAGEMSAEYIPVESEHSALAVCIAASSAGARTFTATSANGLLYMHEQIHWAAGARLPIVMCVANRGVGAPWSVWNDHQDSISQRDTGWIQIHCAGHQQIIDTVIQAFRLAETVRIPVMVCYDGYLLSHTHLPFDIPDQEPVDRFLATSAPTRLLDPEAPLNLNTVTLPDVRPDIRGETAPAYLEIRHQLQRDLERVPAVWAEIDNDFQSLFDRDSHPFFDTYRCRDADFIALCLGSLARQLRKTADLLRENGVKAGVVGLRLYRPFPKKELAELLGRATGVLIFEKALSYGYEGALTSDVKAALYDHPDRPHIGNLILGLGGRTIKTEALYQALAAFCAAPEAAAVNQPGWIGLKC